MTCFFPNMILINKTQKEYTGKNKIVKFLGYHQTKDLEFYEKDNKRIAKENMEWIKVPCGQCEGCRLDKSREWAIRIINEATLYKHNYFITFTYDDDHINIRDEKIDENGKKWENDGSWGGDLEPDEFTKFIKKLRMQWERHHNHKGIRYFYCGEYGSDEKTARPHYHAILFNFPIYDISNPKIKDGKEHFNSKEIEKLWEKGKIDIVEVNFDTAAYVARYTMKKVNGELGKEYYAKKGQTKEYVRMSRKPGIGKQYYEAHKEDIYTTDSLLSLRKNGDVIELKPPAYYDKLFDLEYPAMMDSIKEDRKEKGKKLNKLKMSKTSLTEKEQLAIEKATLHEKTQLLKRKEL